MTPLSRQLPPKTVETISLDGRSANFFQKDQIANILSFWSRRSLPKWLNSAITVQSSYRLYINKMSMVVCQ